MTADGVDGSGALPIIGFILLGVLALGVGAVAGDPAGRQWRRRGGLAFSNGQP